MNPAGGRNPLGGPPVRMPTPVQIVPIRTSNLQIPTSRPDVPIATPNSQIPVQLFLIPQIIIPTSGPNEIIIPTSGPDGSSVPLSNFIGYF